MRLTYYWAQLPILGEIGPKSVLPSDTEKKKSQRLHCVLDSIPNTRIFKIHSVIVEAGLAKEFQKAGFTGLKLHAGVFTLNKQHPAFARSRRRMPHLLWLEITGAPGRDDFGLDRGEYLIVSERVIEMINRGAHAGVTFAKGTKAPSARQIQKLIWSEAKALVKQTQKERGPRPKSPFIITRRNLLKMIARIRAGDGDEEMIAQLRRTTGCSEIDKLIASSSASETPRHILDRALRLATYLAVLNQIA